LGSFKLLQQVKNDVECRNLIHHNIQIFHVTRLKLFSGTYEDAFKLAQIDNNQSVMRKFLAYKGNPKKRSEMDFEVLFEDGEILWLPYSQDIFKTIVYEQFCEQTPGLRNLLYLANTVPQIISERNATPIVEVQPGDIVFVDIRIYGEDWYLQIGLPDHFHKLYVVEWHYFAWVNKSRLKIKTRCPIMGTNYVMDHNLVILWGRTKVFNENSMVLISEEYMEKYPILNH
jgi:hypothetical protein